MLLHYGSAESSQRPAASTLPRWQLQPMRVILDTNVSHLDGLRYLPGRPFLG
jgi:hypothetical protein